LHEKCGNYGFQWENRREWSGCVPIVRHAPFDGRNQSWAIAREIELRSVRDALSKPISLKKVEGARFVDRFVILRVFRLMRAKSRKYRNHVIWESCLVCDLEDFEFPHLEIP
jgi:hypothetical protein